MATAEKVLVYNAPRESLGIIQWFVSLLASLFGCWHRDVSRPFTRHGQTYRTCLGCGAHKRFDLAKWEDRGGFFYSR